MAVVRRVRADAGLVDRVAAVAVGLVAVLAYGGVSIGGASRVLSSHVFSVKTRPRVSYVKTISLSLVEPLSEVVLVLAILFTISGWPVIVA